MQGTRIYGYSHLRGNKSVASNLTIIIVTWNTREMTSSCLSSIENADPGHTWKVVVVDNASGDHTCEMVKESFPWVHLVENERNLGFGRANNLALRRVKTKYALLMNSDTVLHKETVPEFLHFMEDHPEAGVAGGQLIYPDGRLQNSIVSFPTLLTELTNKSILQMIFPRRYPSKRLQISESLKVDSIIGAAMMVRVDALRTVGFFDEDYFFFLEETDLCLRLKKQGWKVFFIPNAKIVHYQGSSVRLVKPRARVEYQRSLILFFKKNYGPCHANIIKYYGYFKAWVGLIGALFGKIVEGEKYTTWRKYTYLLSWYHQGCPDNMGLSKE